MFWQYSRQIVLEDQSVLERTNPDFPLDLVEEVHLRCDKTTIELRRVLARLAGRSSGLQAADG